MWREVMQRKLMAKVASCHQFSLDHDIITEATVWGKWKKRGETLCGQAKKGCMAKHSCECLCDKEESQLLA